MSETVYDLVVIGAGPGGYVAAVRAAQLGMRVACVERQYLGGTCLNVGCIPSKALLESSHLYRDAKEHFASHGIKTPTVELDLSVMLARKDKIVKQLTGGVGFLFKKNKIDSFIGTGKIASASSVEVTTTAGKQTLQTKNILIATGSAPIELPGLKFDGKNIISSTEALEIKSLPKRMIIVGGGVIGVELGSVWRRLGTEILVVEFTDRLLPTMDKELSGVFHRVLEKQGWKFMFSSAAEKAEIKGDKVQLTIKTGDTRKIEEADKVLVCTGRKPVTDALGLAEVGVQLDKRGFVVIDAHFATNVPGIYAIGDVVGGAMLAHKAEDEGIAAAELLAGKAGHVNYNTIPGVVYTNPEFAQVGLTEDEARAKGHEVKVGKFPLSANGRAKSMDAQDGLVKVVGDAKTDRLLGVQILSPHASDMIAEAVLAMEFHSSVEDIARTTHAHPTLSEAFKEAAMACDKRAIHI